MSLEFVIMLIIVIVSKYMSLTSVVYDVSQILGVELVLMAIFS